MPDYSLTARQFEILVLAAWRSNKEIAHDLGISQGAVRNHLTDAYSQLEIEGNDKGKRIQALRRAGIIRDR